MSEARVVKTINASADAVWAHLGDFKGIEAGGPIKSIAYEGDGIGMVRTIGMGGGFVVERLEAYDSTARSFTYAIINEDCPLPFRNYSATVNIVDRDDGSTTVEWTGTFDAHGVDEEQAVNVATGIYAGAIKAARTALEVE